MSVYAKGMIFAAGLGTRLRPFTLEHPKALVDVCGRPALARVIDRFVAIGINDITVNVHHFASQVEKYLSEHAPEGVTIHVSDESDKLLDTGGGLVHAMRYLDGDAPILVHNADIISDIDLHDILECHCRTGASITMAVQARPSARHLHFERRSLRLRGWTHTDDNGRIVESRPQGYVPDSDDMPMSFDGIHVIQPSVLADLAEYGRKMSCNGVFSITPAYVSMCRQRDIRGYVVQASAHWYDVGRPETLRAACDYVSALNKSRYSIGSPRR